MTTNRTSSNEAGDGRSTEPLLRRLRLIVWSGHQTYIAGFLLLCLVGMPAYFGYRAYRNGGLIEIDKAAPMVARFSVDINLAPWQEIVVLPGVGEKLAKAIVVLRDDTGPFESPEDLLQVPGIGKKKLEAIRPFLLPIESRR